VDIKIKKITGNAYVPTQGSPDSAGYDLYSNESAVIECGECVKIHTGIAMETPKGFFGAVFPRSGLATKQGLRLANGVAVIDSDYRGEWIVPLYNDSKETQKIEEGDRIAQVVFLPHATVTFDLVNELDETERGAGGFGSTGVNQ
jgi:dUTP pyrophosphatase